MHHLGLAGRPSCLYSRASPLPHEPRHASGVIFMTAHADLSPTLQLAIDLIRRPSVTPVDADCQKLMMQRLGDAGFKLEPMRIEDVGSISEKERFITDSPAPRRARRGAPVYPGTAGPGARSAHGAAG